MRDIRQMHPEVVDHVGPLPAALRGDRGGAVHEVLQHRVEAARREALEPVGLASLADVGVVLGQVRRHDPRVVVERDAHTRTQEPFGPLLLLGCERIDERLDTTDLGWQLELEVVRSRFQVGERAVAVPALLGLHEPETYVIRILAATVSDPVESFDDTPITGILTTSPGVAFARTDTTILIVVDAPTASSSG